MGQTCFSAFAREIATLVISLTSVRQLPFASARNHAGKVMRFRDGAGGPSGRRGKLAALSAGADIVRREILGKSSPSEQAQSGPFNPAGFRRSSGLSSSEAAPFSAAVKRVFCKTD